MTRDRCAGCGRAIDREFRFCPWCAEPQRSKLVEFFPAHPAVESDRGKALRASRYLDDPAIGPHVRLSVWNESGEAEAAVSLDPSAAGRLARFLRSCEAPAQGEDAAVAAEDETAVLEPARDAQR